MSEPQLLETIEDARGFGADVIIAGSGAGALAVAGEVARRGRKVLLVEAGPHLGGPAARHRRNLTDADAFLKETLTRLKPHANAETPWPGLPGAAGVHAVGGTLNYWSHMVPRPDLALEWDGTIAPADFLPFLERAEQLFWATQDLYGEGSPRQRWIVDTLNARFGSGFAQRASLGGRQADDGTLEFSAGDSLIEGAGQRLAILASSVVTRVAHDKTRATGFDIRSSRDQATGRIEADVIVVGAGTIGTPQLLVASGFGQPAVGRYLTDHLNMVSRVLLKEQDAPRDASGDPPVWLRVPVAKGRDFQVGILDIPSTAHAGILAGAEHLRTSDIGCFVGTDPVASNRLIFDAETPDSLGMPSVRAEVVLTQGDHERVKRALAMQYDIAAAIGVPWRGMSPLLRPFGSSIHLMGTYRIGRDAETSVADSSCRMWGFDNIYLAGNGLLGSLNHCNPTLTTAALGLVAADAICEAA